jgi:hypothetical protein
MNGLLRFARNDEQKLDLEIPGSRIARLGMTI